MSRPIVLVGPRAGRRTDSMIEAIARLGYPPPTILDYDMLLNGTPDFAPGAWVRMESPDDDRDALLACYKAGADACMKIGRETTTGPELEMALDMPGWVGRPSQLALGIVAAAERLEDVARKNGACVSVDRAGLSLAYDKTACQAKLQDAGLPVAKVLPAPDSFEALLSTMKDHGQRRVYVKPQHGAGGGGTIALALGPRGEMVGYTAVEATDDQTVRQSKRIRRVTDRRELARIVDGLVPLGLHVEAWLPKISLGGKVCDLRFVMIRGQAPCAILRKGQHTMTNLHLDAERDLPDELRKSMPKTAWAALERSAHAAFDLFPGMHMVGLDIAVLNGAKRHAILEVNAFGDHIRRMTFEGHTLQELQLIQAMKGHDHAA